MADDIAFPLDLERFERHRRRYRVAAVAEVVGEGADLGALRN
jgi:hypothetical protein